MADASYIQASFLGGAWSQSMQGRIDRPDYRTAMNVCYNAFPLEQGAWVRRGGTKQLATTRLGRAGRIQALSFKQSAPYTVEFTHNYVRFFSGDNLVMTNDQRDLVTISATNPAEVEVASAHNWSTGNTIYFRSLSTGKLALHNRPCLITVTSATKFTIIDGVSGASIDGATLGSYAGGAVVRVLEIVAPYVGTLWQDVRLVAADIPLSNSTTPGAVLLHPTVPPYVLQVTAQPTSTTFATLSLAAAVFKDGPYFDPVPGGTLATPSGLVGNISVTLSFNAYSASVSYSVGDYVVSGGICYKSLIDANLNNTPAGAPTAWATTTAADAIGPNGFTNADIGRHIRLYSEPPLWVVGGTYTAGTSVVAYAGVYWKALANSTGATTNTPNTTPATWALFPTGAIWTWGRITGLTNIIDRALAGSGSIGDMTGGGGLSAAFDGVISTIASASAEAATTTRILTSYVGKDYSGASDQTIAQAVVYPATDTGLASVPAGGSLPVSISSVVLNLRGKASLPTTSADGTLLATSGAIANTTAPVTLVSTDQTTAWKYVWIEQITTATNSALITNAIAELAFVSPAGTGTSSGVTVQVVGDPLLYTSSVRVWRLGLYSNTTGWPAVGTYHEGRLFLAGQVVNNRWDASRSGDIFNMAPTNPDGTVPGNAAISYKFNSDDVNSILWMAPDQLGIICGTNAGEWLIQASALNSPLTPTNVQAHRVMKHKCANIEPRRTGLTLTVVQAFKRTLLEFFHDNYTGKFAAHNIALTGKHLTKTGLAELAYQQELTPIIWARRVDNTLVGWTYKRETLVSSQPPEFAGGHIHALGSGSAVESICTGSNTGGTLDALMMVTKDPTSGIRYVERMVANFEEDDALSSAWQVDGGITPDYYTSTSSSFTIYGLWPYVGKSVTVYGGGFDLGDYTVSSLGTITMSFGDGMGAGLGGGLFTKAFVDSFGGVNTMPVAVGYTFTSKGQIVRPATPVESGARNGPAVGKKRRNMQFTTQMAGVVTGSVRFGTSFSGTLRPFTYKSAGGNVQSPLQQFTGVHWDTIEDDYSFDGMIAWQVTRPYPVMIANIGGMVHTMDK